MEFLFSCFLIAFSIWNAVMWSTLSYIKDDLSAIRRLLENKDGNGNGT